MLRAARYLQPSSPRQARRVSREDVDRITRLYEAVNAAHMVLQFGEYKGVTLVRVAELDPEYVRRCARPLGRSLQLSMQASGPGRARARVPTGSGLMPADMAPGRRSTGSTLRG